MDTSTNSTGTVIAHELFIQRLLTLQYVLIEVAYVLRKLISAADDFESNYQQEKH
jgi:hypothetical protein